MPLAPTEPTNITVAFADSQQAARKVARPALVVVPDADNWNDYGYGLFAKLLVLGDDAEIIHRVSIMFEDKVRTFPFLSAELAKRGPVIEAGNINHPFISLQQNPDHYAAIVQALGFDAAIQGLRQLHDVVLARIEGEDQETLALFNTLPFHIGMARNSPQYVALRRGGQHLRREPAPKVDDAAGDFKVFAKLPSSKRPCELILDFDEDPIFQDRCCVLIGRNGVGKTQLLKAIIEGFVLHTPDIGKKATVPVLEPRPTIRRLIMFSSVPSDPYPKFIEPWMGVDYEYHLLVEDAEPLGSAFLTALLDCLRDDGSAFGQAERRGGREKLLAQSMEKLGLWDDLYIPIKEKNSKDFELVQRIDDVPYIRIDKGLNEYRLGILFHAIDWTKPAAVLNDNFRPRRLSSGELAMANFVAQVVASIETGSLLLFDEPETHLHPAYVSDFMDSLQDLLDITGSIAVIATHSSYIVREVPRQRVNILQARIEEDEKGEDEPIVEIARPQMQTFGSNVDDISRFVFADGIISHRYQRVLQTWANDVGRRLGIDAVIKQYGNELNPETLSYIARAIRNNGKR